MLVLLSGVRLFLTPWTAAHQAPCPSLSPRVAQTHVQQCHSLLPLLLLPSVFPIIRVFSNVLTLRIRLAKVLELQLQHQSAACLSLEHSHFKCSVGQVGIVYPVEDSCLDFTLRFIIGKTPALPVALSSIPHFHCLRILGS